MEPYFYANLCRALDCEEFIADQGTNDPARRGEIADRFAAAFKTRSADEWHELLNEVDICAKPVFRSTRRWQMSTTSPAGWSWRFRRRTGARCSGGVAPKLSATPGRVRGGAPTRGQDSEELLASLGFTAEAVAELREREVVA